MDSEFLTCLLKFIEYFPDYLSALSRSLLRFFWTTFVETAVYIFKCVVLLSGREMYIINNGKVEVGRCQYCHEYVHRLAYGLSKCQCDQNFTFPFIFSIRKYRREVLPMQSFKG